MTFFSIIVPIYNVAKYLHQCLDSILSQSYPNYEVILVDDGSTDGSAKICDEYATQNSSFHVIHQTNQGVCIARKVGVQNAKGDYVCWVDGDDYVDIKFLENFKKIIDDYAPDVIASDYKRVSDDGTLLYVSRNEMPSGKLYLTEANFYNGLIYDYEIARSNCGTITYSLWNKAIKREILKDCMLAVPDQVCYGEDMAAVMLALCKSVTVYVADLCNYYYRWNPTSITNSPKIDDFQRKCIQFDFLEQSIGKIPQRNIDAYIFNQVLQHVTKNVPEYGTYGKYYAFVKESLNIYAFTYAIMDRIKLPKRPIKEYIISFLLKHRYIWGIWAILYTKKKIAARLKRVLKPAKRS